jgi:glyceraldehyde 3-phosphate dehydrogenase
MSVRIGINGFGRIGRALLRASLERDLGVDVAAVNELVPIDASAGLLARDSVYGRLGAPVTVSGDRLLVAGHSLRYTSERDPSQIKWEGIDVVVDSTGHFRTRASAASHLHGGVQKVVVSAPVADADVTIVLGVNSGDLDPSRHRVISNASCTTNCLAPMVLVLAEAFGVERGFVTTVHAYTGDQALVDGPHNDPRRARAAAVNIVPTSTGAAKATDLVLSSADGRLDGGTALRVPVPDGSITDLVVELGRPASVDEVNLAFEEAASEQLRGIIDYSREPLVSTDIIGASASCVFDSGLTMAAGRLAKVFGWYDNEWGYANRLGELAALAAG